VNKIWAKFKKNDSYLLIALFLAVCVTTVTLIGLHRFPYNSDDVAEQTILQYWRTYGIKDTWLPPDPWIFKFPIYALIDKIFPEHSRRTILIGSLAMNTLLVFFVSAFIAFLVKLQRREKNTQLSVSRKLLIAVLPAYMMSLSMGFVISLRIPNTRNLEIGLMLVVLTYVIWLLYDQHRRPDYFNKKALALLVPVSVFAGLLYYSDPYFLVYGNITIATILFFKILSLKDFKMMKSYVLSRSFGIYVALVAASTAGYFFFKSVFAHIGLHVYKIPLEIPGLSNLGKRLLGGFKGLSLLFNVDISSFGLNFSTAVGFINAGVAVSLVILVCRTLRVRGDDRSLKQILLRSLSLQIPIIFLLYTLTQESTGVSTVRYLVLLPIFLLASVSLSLTVNRRINASLVNIVFVSVILAIVVNVINLKINEKQTIKHFVNYSNINKGTNPYAKQNDVERLLIEALDQRELVKGYSSYWNAIISTYLTNGKVEILPILCSSKNTVEPFYWVVQDKPFIQHSEKSFVVFDNRYMGSESCGFNRLGAFSEEFNVSPGVMVRVYPFDIATKFERRENFQSPFPLSY
jgi:hypothetical protein